MNQSHRNITDEKTRSVAAGNINSLSSKDKEFEQRGEDSGFLSGPLSSELHSNQDFEEPQKILEQRDYREDNTRFSGGIKSSGEIDTNIQDSNTEEEMLIDSGVVTDVSESLSKLNLDSKYSNNLGAASSKRKDSKKSTANIIVPTITTTDKTIIQNTPADPLRIVDRNQKEAWETYYQQNQDGDTHLHLAIIHGLADVVQALIQLTPHPCLLDIQNDHFQAPLHLAVITSQPNIVRKLLFSGAEISVRDRQGNSPLHLACSRGDLACVKALTNSITNEEIVALQKTVRLYKTPSVRLPDFEQRNYEGELCVHIATLGNHIDILRQLMCSGADLNAREGKAGRTPLHLAIQEGLPQIANFLLDECVDKLRLETLTYGGLTAYQFAVMEDNHDILKSLSKRGAEPLSPPESDEDSDYDDNMMDHYTANQSHFYNTFNGAKAINVS